MAKEIERELLCDLTEDEVRTKAQQIAAAVAELDQVKSAKADASKDFKRQLEEINERMRRLGREVRSRTERRMIICRVDYHTPQIRFKRITRLDTGEMVQELPMTDEECQQRIFEPNGN